MSDVVKPPAPALRPGEFVAMIALMISLPALSIDAMLPALPRMGADLGVSDPNAPQLVVPVLLLGLGLGQLVFGPLSDSVGRKPAIHAGFVLFLAGCLMSILATDFAWMLAGRLLQGIGASAPRVVTIALVRDQYSGAQMARIMSFVMSVFILVPAIAPAIGQTILLFSGWRTIFGVFFAIASIAFVWFAVRQPETLAPRRRTSLSVRHLVAGARQVFASRVALGYSVAAGFVFAAFIGYLSSAQQIFQQTYGVGAWFPACFGSLALAIGAASLVNARLVVRHGMRRLSGVAIVALTAGAAAFLVIAWRWGGVPPFAAFMAWGLLTFFCIGLLFGNLNALAMEPLGHIAGIGAALVGALSTTISVPIGAFIGQAYDGTVFALVGGFTFFGAAAFVTMCWLARKSQA